MDVKKYEELLENVKLEPVPKGQLFVAKYFLTPLYKLRNLKIVFEGMENIPDYPVIFVMNHTDRYNYWPFQYKLYLLRDKIKYCYTTTWVKLKYYENKYLAKFFSWTGNLPLPSKGYLMLKDLRQYFGNDKKVLSKYFKMLKAYPSNKVEYDEKFKKFIAQYGDYKKHLEEVFTYLMTKIYYICKDAIFEKKLNLLIFPEGTRSKRLISGKTGAVQFAMSYGIPVVPVGCNGSDKVYTRDIPWIEKNKTIVYRIGKPIKFFEMPEFNKIEKGFIPFTEKAEKNRLLFAKATKYMMEKIADLLDDEYKPLTSAANEKNDIEKFMS